ncbi:MAG: leucine-rich repeat protein [Muribaculaceae bacterium]|nr:leucine-rich repeat protein [Muribaculaceae bacterium]
MKKRTTFAVIATMAALWGSAFTSGKFNYNIVGENEVEIARPTDTSESGAYTDVTSFPSTVTYGGTTYTVVGIGERAFQYAEVIGATMPSTYRYVGPWAFFQAYGVSVKIGANVDSIALGAFAGNHFTNFLCDLNNPKYSLIYPGDVDEDETWVGGVLADKNKETIIAFPGYKKDGSTYLYTYTVPRRIKHIANHAFNRNPVLKKVYFHEGVEDIGEYAFYGCENMTSVEIPGTTKLSYGSFAACEFTLQQIILHEGVTEIPAYCFFDADPLTDLQLPSTLELIGEGAFSHCANLESVTFPENLLACDPQAFSNCTKLANVNVNDKCVFLGQNCFMNCTSLTSFDLKNVQYLGATAFNTCTSISTVTSAGLQVTGRAPFYNCTSLESVEFPETLVELGPVAFMKCRSLTSAVIPASAQVVGDGFACGATALTAIQLAEGNQNYVVDDNGVLYTSDMKRLVSLPGTMAITEFTVPAAVEVIGEQACRWTNLTKLNTSNVKVIAQTAFGESSALTEVTFGAACDSINEMAFGSCSAIVKVTSLNTVPPAGGVFDEAVYNAATLYVPTSSKEAYQAHTNWGKFANIEEIGGEQPSVRGDLNGDGSVDVEDVNIIINLILEATTPEQIAGNADINDDGTTDIEDVNTLINLILEQ